MRKLVRAAQLVGAGVVLLQFGGCFEYVLGNLFFELGPLFL